MPAFQDLPAPVRYAVFGVVVTIILVIGWASMRESTEPAPDTTPASSSQTTPATGSASSAGSPADAPDSDGPPDGSPAGERGEAGTVAFPVSQDTVDVVADDAVKFATTYVSFRYDQDGSRVVDALRPYLADDTVVDLTGFAPDAILAAESTAKQTVIDAAVTNIDLVVASAYSLTYSLDVETTTRTRDTEARSEIGNYTVAFVNEAGAWGVSQFFLAGTDGFIDE